MHGTLFAAQNIESDATAMPVSKLGATAGDAVPLRVGHKRLCTAAVIHATNHPHAVIRVILSFTLNFRLEASGEASLVVSSLAGISLVADAYGTPIAAATNVPLHDDTSSGERQIFSASISADHAGSALLSDAGDIVLIVIADMLPEVEYRVSFYTRNTDVLRLGRDLSVRVAQLANTQK